MAKNWKVSINLLLFFSFTYLAAQEFPEKEFKKELKAKKIEVLPPDYHGYFKVKNRKTGKWGAHQWYFRETLNRSIFSCRYDSIGWPTDTPGWIILKANGKYGISGFPALNDTSSLDVDCEFEQILVPDGEFHAFVKQGGKWGLIDLPDNFMFIYPEYDRWQDVPMIKVPEWKKPLVSTIRKELNADMVVFDGSGDGVFKARSRTSQKWGMFQRVYEGDIRGVIPMKYDSLYFFSYNGIITPVFNDGKIGLHLSPFSYGENATESVPCVYEDYQEFNVQIPASSTERIEKMYIAVKKNGKWGWIDWLNGEEKSGFIYATVDDLPFPYFYQETLFEE